MAPVDGLTHPKRYDIKDSNVEFIGTDIDHRVKYQSAQTEPAWNNGYVGQVEVLCVWRIEDFEVIPWPKEKIGQFYDGDSYIVLNSYQLGEEHGKEKLNHDIFFWLGSKTSQDEAGVAAYKTVELDEFLKGAAVQHREVQACPSQEFLALFPSLRILHGGVQSGFNHVEEEGGSEVTTLLRISKPEGARADSMIVHEVDPLWQSLDDEDVFVLDKGDKIWVWQGRKCSPMEKAKAAQVVHDLTLAKHVDVEVLAQNDARSKLVVNMLGGEGVEQREFHARRPVTSTKRAMSRQKKLFRLSDASGRLSFESIKVGDTVEQSDLDGNDVFILDTGHAMWIWRGLGASRAEKAMWLQVAQSYVRQLQDNPEAHLMPIASVVEGNESTAFMKALTT